MVLILAAPLYAIRAQLFLGDSCFQHESAAKSWYWGSEKLLGTYTRDAAPYAGQLLTGNPGVRGSLEAINPQSPG